MSLQYMTQEGLDKLKKELAEAIAQRPVISAAIAEARDKGDLSENAEYEAAREAQGLLELQIKLWRTDIDETHIVVAVRRRETPGPATRLNCVQNADIFFFFNFGNFL